MYRTFFKPAFDFICALIGLVLISPLLALTIVVLFVQNNGKPFFFQKRPGKNQVPFHIIKFKTMTDKKDVDGNFLPDNQRLTLIGKIIRKLSIDELPQLINVLKGDMSLVGPRPLLLRYIPLYSEEQLRRHEVKPGITGWAQINGRNTIVWEKRLFLDVEYVKKISFSIDMKILMLTIMKVIKSEGVNSGKETTMEELKNQKNK